MEIENGQLKVPIDLGPLKPLPSSYQRKLFFLIDLYEKKKQIK